MLEMFPVVPLAQGQGLAIGITSYDGGVHYGLNGDRDALADVDVLAQALDEALDELLATAHPENG
jgi:diacylglycerol O-acyltransferase